MVVPPLLDRPKDMGRGGEGEGEGKKGGILRMNGGWANESLAGKRDGSLLDREMVERVERRERERERGREKEKASERKREREIWIKSLANNPRKSYKKT